MFHLLSYQSILCVLARCCHRPRIHHTPQDGPRISAQDERARSDYGREAYLHGTCAQDYSVGPTTADAAKTCCRRSNRAKTGYPPDILQRLRPASPPVRLRGVVPAVAEDRDDDLGEAPPAGPPHSGWPSRVDANNRRVPGVGMPISGDFSKNSLGEFL